MDGTPSSTHQYKLPKNFSSNPTCEDIVSMPSYALGKVPIFVMQVLVTPSSTVHNTKYLDTYNESIPVLAAYVGM